MSKKPCPAKRYVAIWGAYWLDTTSVGEGGRELTPMPSLTVGFLVKNEKDYVTLASDAYADASHRDFTSIPRGALKWLRRVGKIRITREMASWSWPDDQEAPGTSKRMVR